MEEDIIDIVKMVSVNGHTESVESPLDYTGDYLEETELPINDHDYNVHEANEAEFLDDEKESEIISVVPSTYRSSSDQHKNLEEPSTYTIPKADKSMNPTVLALKESQKNFKDRTAIKQAYYKEKLKIMERIATAKENSASYRERIAIALETIADSIS